MRTLNDKELSQVAGGMVPIDGNGGGGGGAPSSTNILTNTAMMNEINESSIMKAQVNDLVASHWTIEFWNNPASANGDSSSTDYGAKIVGVATQYESNIPEALGQLAHELGHAEHPTDTNAADYSSADNYAAAMELSEGYAQLNAIHIATQLESQGFGFQLPGQKSFVQQEINLVQQNPSQSDAWLAQQIGQIEKNDQVQGGQTYDQWYREAWSNAHPSSTTTTGGGYSGTENGDTLMVDSEYLTYWDSFGFTSSLDPTVTVGPTVR